MKNGRARLCGCVAAAVTWAVCLAGAMIAGAESPSADSAVESRADIIPIDALKIFGRLERPAVIFLHGRHTAALEKQNKDCTVCHLTEKERLSPKYMRLKDTSKQAVMDAYHSNCIACHRQTSAANEKSGPVVCGECHRAQPAFVSNWQPIGLDKSLHYRHDKAQKNKCEKCHHAYNAETQKLFYAEGQEGACRYCHGPQTQENRISMRLASHSACIACHRQTLAQNESAGPIQCQGCHDPAEQKLIEKVKDVPRMKRKQPDIVLVKTAENEARDSNPGPRMNPVPFDHRAHENYNDTCRACHHADLNACVRCHTLQGTQEGKQVKLEQAMHRLNTQPSCLGCHQVNQRDPRCAGCHASISKSRPPEPSACRACHMALPVPNGDAALPSTSNMRAAMMLERRQPVTDTYAEKDIPETVEIKTLSNKYEPVRLPHRKIVQTLVKNIKDNKLADYFHPSPGTICQGCHHNSPAALKPPACVSCHGQPFNAKDLSKPGLMAAYHRQCMECHQEMGIAKPVATDCTGCHKEKT
ncbi:MAG: hypothetical protein JSW39_22825 [Desulfobacterales bacterium]|nr:MAG: hypothetical protein JSW39_22825 [Desulfobacterales bacterium]